MCEKEGVSGRVGLLTSALVGSPSGVTPPPPHPLVDPLPASHSHVCAPYFSAAMDSAVGDGSVDGSVMSVRLFDVTTRLLGLPGVAGDRLHASLAGAGLVQRLFDAVTGDDILLQVNILHFVPRVAGSRAGAAHLLEAGNA